MRAGKAQLVDSYVLFKDGEAFLLGALITPLPSAATHFVTDPTRTRKLLLNRRELDRPARAAERLHLRGYRALLEPASGQREIALAKGKADYDKRETEKARDWQRQKQRMMRHSA
ncbi:MAG: SsrA-binding protein [Gammaproteobacteria bacterium]|nr:SsrA-binding protein [Gammaproteobacteria bacterium]